jgi:hypothetical protein
VHPASMQRNFMDQCVPYFIQIVVSPSLIFSYIALQSSSYIKMSDGNDNHVVSLITNALGLLKYVSQGWKEINSRQKTRSLECLIPTIHRTPFCDFSRVTLKVANFNSYFCSSICNIHFNPTSLLLHFYGVTNVKWQAQSYSVIRYEVF